ncbi:MAG: TonB-dependent receptor plug domain-containing protein [Pseudomonadota bacterium]
MTFTFFICAALSAASSFEDTIVVTASRSPSLLAEEPLSVSVVDPREASFTLAHHPAELLASVPGALIQAGSGQEHLTALRSPVLTGGAGAGSFLYLQDGVPLRSAGFANVNGLFDAQTEGFDRIEVVRGPGEVTYGSNALHGAVNVISQDPLQAEGGSLAVDAGAFDRYRFLTTQGGGGFYGQVTAYKDGGYRATSGVDQIKGQLAHGTLQGQTTLRSRLSFHQLEQETAGFVLGDDAFENEDLRRSNPNPDAFRNVKHLLFSSEVKSPLASGNITIIPYILWTDMEFLMHFLPSQALEENRYAAGGLLSSFV